MAHPLSTRRIGRTRYTMTTLVRAPGSQEVIGNVSDGGCDNEACVDARRAGRRYHATPSGFAVTLPTYHYATYEEAVATIEAAMLDRRGLRLDLPTSERIEWLRGDPVYGYTTRVALAIDTATGVQVADTAPALVAVNSDGVADAADVPLFWLVDKVQGRPGVAIVWRSDPAVAVTAECGCCGATVEAVTAELAYAEEPGEVGSLNCIDCLAG